MTLVITPEAPPAETDPLLPTEKRLAQKLASHPFLVACRTGSVTRHQLNLFLLQQYKYSVHFTRMLCALMSQLPSSDDFLRLAENLCEEMGFGAGSGIPHSKLYMQMLGDFGLDPAQHETFAETRCLVDTMYLLCRSPDPVLGLGAMCLGAEAIVPHLYGDIVAGFTAHGIDRRRLHFFTLHMECDDAHAQTMRELMLELIAADASAAVRLEAAGEVALQARLRLFDRLDREGMAAR